MFVLSFRSSLRSSLSLILCSLFVIHRWHLIGINETHVPVISHLQLATSNFIYRRLTQHKNRCLWKTPIRDVRWFPACVYSILDPVHGKLAAIVWTFISKQTESNWTMTRNRVFCVQLACPRTICYNRYVHQSNYVTMKLRSMIWLASWMCITIHRKVSSPPRMISIHVIKSRPSHSRNGKPSYVKNYVTAVSTARF